MTTIAESPKVAPEWNPWRLPLLLPEDTTPESAKVYWFFKRRGPSAWGKKVSHNEKTGARCLIGAAIMQYPYDFGRAIDRIFNGLHGSGRRCVGVANWNDNPTTTFSDVLNLCKELGV